jgi:hypothetical protein
LYTDRTRNERSHGETHASRGPGPPRFGESSASSTSRDVLEQRLREATGLLAVARVISSATDLAEGPPIDLSRAGAAHGRRDGVRPISSTAAPASFAPSPPMSCPATPWRLSPQARWPPPISFPSAKCSSTRASPGPTTCQ